MKRRFQGNNGTISQSLTIDNYGVDYSLTIFPPTPKSLTTLLLNLCADTN